MSISWGKTVALVGGAYLVPKVLSYLTTHPTDTTSTIRKAQECLANTRDVLEEIAGEDLWFVISKIIGENGWIGVAGLLGFRYYLSLKAISVIPTTALSPTFIDRVTAMAEKTEQGMQYGVLFVSLAGTACIGRTILGLD